MNTSEVALLSLSIATELIKFIGRVVCIFTEKRSATRELNLLVPKVKHKL